MRLIDADALKKTMKAILLQCIFSDADDEEIQAIKIGEKVVREFVDELPTIDAVPVVRCRECIHAIKFRTGQVSCRYHDWCRIHVDANGYCDHGEKEDDNATD